MALDPRFICASDLQSLFRDKDTGLPLRNGVIYFWKDQARSVPKDVYKISGSAPNYSFTNIGSEVTLTSAGTMSDNENPANDIVLYYFPYEGDAENSDGTVELYFVQVYSEGGTTSGVLQFTREAWPPNVESGSDGNQNLLNYIPNGQFKIHIDIPGSPNDTPYVAGEIREPITVLSQGGWTFERPAGSTAKDIVTFESFEDYVSNPTASPRYAIRIKNEVPAAGDAYKDLRIKFNDVNKFASDTQEYTYGFTGKSNTGSSVSVSLILIKNFGTGGDPTEETAISNLTITNSFTIVQTSGGFVFGDNSGKTISLDNDDFLQLAIRFPTASVFDVSITDKVLTDGDVLIESFPQTTDMEFAYETITPAIPAYNSYDLYLKPILTPIGLSYDRTEIGTLRYDPLRTTPPISFLPCDGLITYETAAYSSDLIPYARLQEQLWLPSLNLPKYGTGLAYFVAQVTTNTITVTNNTVGLVTDASDGTPATGFTITTPTPGTPSVYQITSVVTVAASAIPAGSYFNIYSKTGSEQRYYVWYRKDGAGTDPAPVGALPILVDILTADTAAQVATKTQIAMNMKYFATPDWRGVFFRVWDNGRGLDPDAASRASKAYSHLGVNPITGDVLGTYQSFQLQDHGHHYLSAQDDGVGGLAAEGGGVGNQDTVTSGTGGAETRPLNEYTNVFMKY